MTRDDLTGLLRKYYPTISQDDFAAIDDGASDALLNDPRMEPMARVRTAVRAWIRHTQTEYDWECRAVSKSFARERAEKAVMQKERELFQPTNSRQSRTSE